MNPQPATRNPSAPPIDAGEALRWLQGALSGLDAGRAVAYLDGLDSTAGIMALYRKFFPREFGRSKAVLFEPCDSGGLMTKGAAEFVELVNARLFPLDDFWVADVMEADGGIDFIPIQPIQAECWMCGEFDPSELPTVFRLAFGLKCSTETEIWGDLADELGIETRPAMLTGSWFESMRKLGERVARERTPLRHLRLAVLMTEYSTGNGWVDLSCQDSVCLDWTEKNVRMLARVYKEAQEMMGKVFALDRWLDADRRARVAAAVNLWNRALSSERSNARVRTGARV